MADYVGSSMKERRITPNRMIPIDLSISVELSVNSTTRDSVIEAKTVYSGIRPQHGFWRDLRVQSVLIQSHIHMAYSVPLSGLLRSS